MKTSVNLYKRLWSNIRNQAGYSFSHYKWLITRNTLFLKRKILYSFRVFRAKPELRSQRGERFLELYFLVRDFLRSRLNSDSEHAKQIAGQLLNVLKHCDEITYEEEGTAEAYALLHFLDRYHRFQIIFDTLHTKGLMPIKVQKIDILDVGTGPGPSMYAISDFYTSLNEKIGAVQSNKDDGGFSIDYVERSQEFRNWLHHFTEYVNFNCPSKHPWKVPFHHGSFYDFKGLEFNQYISYSGQDDDGEFIIRNRVEKYRFDIILGSNFFTTKEQVDNYLIELRDCVRFLRNNGILIVVGAKSSSKKYSSVYEEISNTILSENYSNWKFIAKCEKLDFGNPVMGYSWGDGYGERIKELIRDIYLKLQSNSKESIAPEMTKILDSTIRPDYSNAIDWEVHVFRKKARMRRRR